MKTFPKEVVQLEKIVGGGQALGTLADGRKVFVWGGLPGEKVEVQLTKSKSKMAEAVVTEVIEPSDERVEPKDPESYLSTSPWQIMSADAEARHKTTLINDAFELHHISLPSETTIYSDDKLYGYRNKVEFSFYGSTKFRAGNRQPTESDPNTTSAIYLQPEFVEAPGPSPEPGVKPWSGSRYEGSEGDIEQLDLAFYRRGTHGKVIVDGTSLARDEINTLAWQIRDALSAKGVAARQLKTLLIRCNQHGNAVWQLYVKDKDFNALSDADAETFPAQGGEIIYSDPKSPASRITKRLLTFGDTVLSDTILGVPFRYATEGFFQVNIPVYEQSLRDMRLWVSEISLPSIPLRSPQQRGDTKSQLEPSGVETADGISARTHVIDLYSGVGTIGLTIGGDNATLVEVNEDAVREMRANIKILGKNAEAILAPSEKALEYVTSDATIILDPPRAGLHDDVTEKLVETMPPRIVYLSCNPVTQARDVAKLLEKYDIISHQGYNFFPRTPHIEHLVVLDKKPV